MTRKDFPLASQALGARVPFQGGAVSLSSLDNSDVFRYSLCRRQYCFTVLSFLMLMAEHVFGCMCDGVSIDRQDSRLQCKRHVAST